MVPVMSWSPRALSGLLAATLLAAPATPALGSAAGVSGGATVLNVVLGIGGLVMAGWLVYWNARPGTPRVRSTGPGPGLDPEAAARSDARTASVRAARAERVAAAAEAAAARDPWLAPATVRDEAGRLARDVLAAWDAADTAALEGLLAPALLSGWVRALNARTRRGGRPRMAVRGPLEVEYVGLSDVPGEADDRVVVRVSAEVEEWAEDPVTGAGPRRTAALRRYWTLARRDGRWVLVADRDDAAGAQVLHARIVTTSLSATPAT